MAGCPPTSPVFAGRFAVVADRDLLPSRKLSKSVVATTAEPSQEHRMNTKQLIGDQIVSGEGPAEKILDPAEGRVIAEVNEASTEQVARATQAAARAFPGWAATPPKDRSLALLKIADAVEARGPELAQIESRNTGKPYALALADEIPAIADVFRFFAGAARCLTGAVTAE